MPAPLFSIVTVSFNRGHEIEATFDSVARQTCRDREYIVVDALSTDRTPEVLARHAGGIDVLIREKDKGIYDGMNKGLRAGRGELVVFLNAGDVFASDDVLDRTARAWDRAGRPDLLYGDVVTESVAGVRKLVRYPEMGSRLLWRGTVCHQAIFARRGLFGRTGEFGLRHALCADFEWLCRAWWSAGARAVRTGIPTAVFRLDGRTSREYVMHERFDILKTEMPRAELAALGVLDAGCRLLGGAGSGKRVLRWARRLLGWEGPGKPADAP